MRGTFEDQGDLFSYISPERRVPETHPLRKVRELTREVFAALDKDFRKLYAQEGRPSIPPEQLLSALLLQVFYGVREAIEAIRQTPDMVVEALRRIAAGTTAPVSQEGATYYYVPSKPEWDELIDWMRPTEAILARLRARTPGPSGTYIHDGLLWRIVAFADEPLLAAHDNVPGQVIARRKDFGVLVKTGDTGFWITRIEPAEGGESFVPTHHVGSMLRQNLDKDVFDIKRHLALLEAMLEKNK